MVLHEKKDTAKGLKMKTLNKDKIRFLKFSRSYDLDLYNGKESRINLIFLWTF